MKFLKILLFILFLSSFGLVKAWYNYPYVCNNSSCYETELKELNKTDNWYFMTNEDLTSISNLSNYINNKLQDYEDYYGNSDFKIDDYYSWTWSIYDKELTLTQLLDINTTFYIAHKSWGNIYIDETYNNWKEFLFDNFKDVIDELHYWFPYWQKKNKLSDILENITWYNQTYKRFYLKNVCTDLTCFESKYYWILYYGTSPYTLLTWDIKHNSQFVLDTFKVSNDYSISHIYLKAGGSADFEFWFEDYLDVGSVDTKYKYTISYQYEWDTIQKLFSETIKVATSNYKVTSDTIDQDILDDMIELTVLNNTAKKIKIWIKEWLKLTKVWKITFYLAVENLNTWDKFDTTPVNQYSPLYVIPNDNVKSWESIIYWFSKASNDVWYNIWDTFSVTLNLFDEYWNKHYDYIDWYDISLMPWTSNFIELSKAWSDVYSTSLIGVKSAENTPYPINFKFRITKAWYHDLNWFRIKIRNKKNTTSYETTPTYTYYNLVPSDLYYDDKFNTIHIKSPLITDFPITCTSWSITLKAVCSSDNFSWCNSSMNQSITFTSEADNWSMWTLSIRDFAHNVKNFNYTMNHIDKTAPIITVFKGSNLLPINSYKYKANDDPIKINFYEQTTSNCNSQINYLVRVNWVAIYDSYTWSSNLDATINSFFHSDWAKELYIKATDKYWNFSERIINFTVYPDDLDPVKTTLSVNETGTKDANNSDYYIYTISLKDKYDNPIYNKTLSLVNQDCTSYTWCSTLKTNMSWMTPTWDDALIEYSYGTNTNSLWQLNFRLKSLAPWVFTNRFKIRINEWNDNYVNIATTSDFYISSTWDNSFNKLFYWELFASDDDWISWSALPEYGTDYKYKLQVTPIPFSSSFTTNITNFRNDVRAVDSTNSDVQWVSAISWLNTKTPIFTARINTSTTATSFWIPWLQISDNNDLSTAVISYNLWWETIYSVLSSNLIWADRTPISIKNETWDVFLWVQVIWILQWSGKSDFTWQEKNFSDISKSDMRTTIRKNAFTQIKNMTNNQIINWVKYVVGDTNLSWEITWYETLIVKDWNVIISWDLNNSWKKLWIIVLKDNYDVNSWYTWKWNVYVNSNVGKINAVIYADWWLISSNSTWIPYTSDSVSRSIDLQKQLFMKWSLFTRNTIGWAILAWWDYILPWWTKLSWSDSNFTKAMIYDLNYIRRWMSSCIESSPWVCKYNKWAFVIEYDSKVQTAPPKLFWN